MMYLNTFVNTFFYIIFKISSLFIQSIKNLKMNEILDIKLVRNFNSILRRNHQKNSYERRAYESVDKKSLY